MTLEYEEIVESDNSRFGKILAEMFDTYKKKNADYGNSFSETIQEFGYIPAVARINDKVKRMKNIVKGQKMNIENESLRDALLDTANYCVLTIVELDKGK
jgi:peptide subunit release factor 1 (eRF1)